MSTASATERTSTGATPPFVLAKPAKTIGRIDIMVNGEVVGRAVRTGWRRNAWLVQYVTRPVWARLAVVPDPDPKRSRFAHEVPTDRLEEAIGAMLADGRLPYGVALEKVRVEVAESQAQNVARAREAERIEAIERAAVPLYEAARAALRMDDGWADRLR